VTLVYLNCCNSGCMYDNLILGIHTLSINLGSEHIHLFKLVNLEGAELSVFISPTLTRSHVFNQCPSFLDTKSKE
jgi:hypothetical protein